MDTKPRSIYRSNISAASEGELPLVVPEPDPTALQAPFKPIPPPPPPLAPLPTHLPTPEQAPERPIDEYDVDGALEHAQRVLPDGELRETVHRAEEAAGRAGWGEASRWIFGVLVVATIAAVGLRDLRFLPIALLLMAMFAIPIMLAGVWVTHDHKETEEVMGHLHHRAGHDPAPPPVRLPPDEGPLPTPYDEVPREEVPKPPPVRHDPRL